MPPVSETLHKPSFEKAAFRCTSHELTQRGRSRLLLVQLMLMQKIFSCAAAYILQCSGFHQSSHSMVSEPVKSKPPFAWRRFNLQVAGRFQPVFDCRCAAYQFMDPAPGFLKSKSGAFGNPIALLSFQKHCSKWKFSHRQETRS